VRDFRRISESDRLRLLAKFISPAVAPSAARGQRKRSVYVSYSSRDRQDVSRLIADLNKQHIDTWSDSNLLPGDAWDEIMHKALKDASVVLFVVPMEMGPYQEKELMEALDAEKRVIPVLIDRSFSIMPRALSNRHAVLIEKENWSDNVYALTAALARILEVSNDSVAIDAEDPQKGQWGGEKKRNGRELSASVKRLGDGWYDVRLTVSALRASPPLDGKVTFYLHPTFPNPEMSAMSVEGKASINVTAWGAFTVGAVADGGETLLELDLAREKDLPKQFREN
jgi:hypothetical protein